MRNNRLILTALLVSSLAVPFSQRLVAQSDSSSLSGAVTDASGAVLPNAKVTIRSNATGQETLLTTNSSGNFDNAQRTSRRLPGPGGIRRLSERHVE